MKQTAQQRERAAKARLYEKRKRGVVMAFLRRYFGAEKCLDAYARAIRRTERERRTK